MQLYNLQIDLPYIKSAEKDITFSVLVSMEFLELVQR